MKTQEELNALKEEVENVNRKFCELKEEELAQVTGGVVGPDVSGVIGATVADEITAELAARN